MLKQSFLSFSLLFGLLTSHAQTFNSFYNDLVNTVSLSNIESDLQTFESFGIKEIGTFALDNTQAWIKNRYQSLGYTDIVEQAFSYSGGTTHNIIVTKTGTTYPNTYIIIDGHYDTINGPGANDNGSGTVLLLELARILKDVDTEYSIKFIHFSGEESGLIGSNHYVNNTVIPQSLDIELVFNIDEVGGVNGMVNDTVVCEEDRSTPTSNNAASSAITQILANAVELYSTLKSEISYAYGSDYVPFENNGEVITGLFEKNETPYAHTANDLLTNMDVNYLFEVTKGSLGATLHFSGASQTLGTDLENAISKKITIYPNPSKGSIHIKNTSSSAFDIKVLNILGKEVLSSAMSNNSKELDLTMLEKGIYLIVFKNERASFTKKIVLH